MATSPASIPATSSTRRLRRRGRLGTDTPQLHRLIAEAKIELIPMSSLERAVSELRPASSISMTCSPAKSIEATLDESAALIAAGHRVTPHISARMVSDHDHLAAIHARLRALRIRDIFVVGGDADPPGCFFDAIEFLDAFLALDDANGRSRRQIDHIGYTSYPDTHPLITNAQLHEALHRKQDMILSTGRTAHVATQMCFSAEQIRRWLDTERAAGLSVPVHLGVPGVIDRARLMTMGMRLGVGTSLRYLSKNRKALGRLMTQRAFEPTALLARLSEDLERLGIDGLHLYSFNQVDATERWRERTLA